MCQSTIQVYPKLDECIKYVFIYSGWVNVIRAIDFLSLLYAASKVVFVSSMFKINWDYCVYANKTQDLISAIKFTFYYRIFHNSLMNVECDDLYQKVKN